MHSSAPAVQPCAQWEINTQTKPSPISHPVSLTYRDLDVSVLQTMWKNRVPSDQYEGLELVEFGQLD